MPLVLSRGGNRIPVDELARTVDWPAVREKLTWRHTPRVGRVKVECAATRDGNDVLLPRRMMRFLPTVNDMPDGLPLAAGFSPEFALTCNQRVVADAVCGEILANTAALLDMPAGQGKTILAANVISRIGRQAIYVVDRAVLAEQTVKEFARVGMAAAVWPEIADTTIILVQVLITLDVAALDRFGMMVIDEIHRFVGKAWRGIFKIGAKYMLGMSGTICDRVDRPEIFYTTELCCGGAREPIVAAKLPGWQVDGTKFKVVVKAIYYHGADEFTQSLRHEATGCLFTPWMDKMFLADPSRMALISSEIRRLLAANHTGVYVFCIECKPLDEMAAALAEFEPRVVGVLHSKTAAAAKQTAMVHSRVILTTYGFSSTGLSLPRMTAMVLTTPRRNGTEQVIKRIMRFGSDMDVEREIVDIIDAKTPLRSQFRERKRTYVAAGARIVKVTI